MSMVILSIRQGRELGYRGEEGYCEGDCRLHAVNTIEEAAQWLVQRLREDLQATYSNYLFRTWLDVLGCCYWDLSEGRREDSIFVGEPAQETPEEITAREQLEDRLRSLVADELGEHSQRHLDRLAVERQRQEAEKERLRLEAKRVQWEAERSHREQVMAQQLAQQEAQDRAEYERLKKKFGL